jgi:dTDP-4-amino-4,6-dideoxygalactose transaminase
MVDRLNEPIYVTRPLFPDLDLFTSRLKDVWASQWLSNGGPQHVAFETAVQKTLNVPHLSLFNNGTIALIVAVQSLRLQGEVITTPFTFPATTHVLAWNNITPVFCDIDPETLTLDPSGVEALITHRTTGILGVHVYGIPCNVARIGALAEQHGLRVVYDAAHAFQTEVDGVGIGNFGDISMFSFHPTKLFHSGEGGCLTMADANLKARVDLLKNFGIKNEVEVIMPGINGKMNELQALMGLLVLDIANEERDRRRIIRERYARNLSDLKGLRLVEVPAVASNSQQYLVIRVDAEVFGASRDDVYDQLRLRNVYARKYFYPLTTDYPCYKHLPTARAEMVPNAARAAKEVLCLPFYGNLPLDKVDFICEAIQNIRPARKVP